jgi:hypothetical protein
MAVAKLVVTKARGGSRITLVGTSGTELLTSKVFTEPRGKGATLRSLKGLLGENIVVEDQTVRTAEKAGAEEKPAAADKPAAAPRTTARVRVASKSRPRKKAAAAKR